MTGPVLAIFAHPDDESILAGGTLAACAAAGWEVIVLCVTRGELGPIARPDLASRATLGVVRECELLAASRELGASIAQCLSYPDGDLSSVAVAEIVEDLAQKIRRWRPEALLTFGPEGLYWHPDHIAVHRYTMAALDTLGGEFSVPWVYHATWPRGQMARLVSAMASRGLAVSLWGLNSSDFGAPALSMTTILDVRPFLPQKLRAVRSHRSQLASDHLFLLIPDNLAEEFLGREYFVRARPHVGSGDFLAEVVSWLATDGKP